MLLMTQWENNSFLDSSFAAEISLNRIYAKSDIIKCLVNWHPHGSNDIFFSEKRKLVLES